MNDEQQLWRDVKKFFSQFPSFLPMAKKIGEIGDIEEWRASVQRNLESVTQEVEKQRLVLASERAAADADAARGKQELEARALEHAERMKTNEGAARANSDQILADANGRAAKIISDAEMSAKAIDKEVAGLRAQKAKLSDEIADLTDKLTALKNSHSDATDALEKVKQQHAGFVKKLLGTADV